jgi:hypothetical protein
VIERNTVPQYIAFHCGRKTCCSNAVLDYIIRVVKAFDYDLKLGPVVTGILLVLAALAVMFFLLYAHRMQTLHRADFVPCMQQKTYMAVSKCVGLKVRDYIKHPQWQAAQFTCYMLVAIISGIFCGWSTGYQRPVAVPLIAVLSALAASGLFKPWGLVTFAAFLGVLLGGAIFQVFIKRRGG